MGTLSIHNLDPSVEQRIRQQAKESGKSINQTIKELLAKATGVEVRQQDIEQRRYQYEDLCGSLSQEDWEGMQEIFDEMRQINPEDWT
jgi:hypothetical protein